MRAFIWTAIIIGALECVGKAMFLDEGNTTRNLKVLPLYIGRTILYIMWGMYLLGANP